MRISDWSSDVCSSDLGAVEESASGYLCGNQCVARPRCVSSWRSALSRRRAGLLRPHSATVGSARALHDDRGAGMTHSPYAGSPHALRLDLIRIAGWIARSEEHTSELQSLMRISYAVFC